MATSQHHAQFYEQDDFLIETVSGFLAVGMASEATCLVIATKNHCDGFVHGGTIWVESAPEHGSIFHISLPLIKICAEAAL